ncbi:hypothetical protein [Mesorhizobium argentiipisi]|uniref:Dihydrodipicolinate reductase n=1 Tax=Mesorhizobium argentiipisi TaxID=3015175 RepID=A0ABU8KAP7_9HYPH
MPRKIRVLQFGSGRMATYLMRYVIDKEAELVAVFDRNARNIGVDIGTRIGKGDLGLAVRSSDGIEEFLKTNRPDICIVATRSLLRDVKDILLLCARYGVNVVTLCDEALYPWNSSPTLAQEIDEAAKKGNCTITGSGFPELCWAHLVTTVAGGANRIVRIAGTSTYNADDFGIALAEHHGVGLAPEAFEKEIAAVDKVSNEERTRLIMAGLFNPVPTWNANGWLCSKMGLSITSQIQRCIPVFHFEPVFSKTLGREITPGNAIGMSARTTTETAEGITFETEGVGKIYLPGESDQNFWELQGEPNIKIDIPNAMTKEMVCSIVVNRLPDVIAAKPGFVTTDNFGPPMYRSRPLLIEGVTAK